MKRFLQRLRGIIGTGLTWAVGWMGFYGVVILPILAVFGLIGGGASFILNTFIGVGIAGFVAGSAFGVVLSILERHKKLEDLSFKRIALWGGLGGLAFGAMLGPEYWGPAIFVTLLGIGSATGSVALARRKDTKLIEGEEDPVLSLEGE